LLLLPVGGKYYTHLNGANSTNALLLFEQMLKELGIPIDIAHTEAHVPSFMEKWVFYQVTRLEGEVKEEVMGEDKEEAAKLTNGTETPDKKEEISTEDKKEEKKEAKEEKKKSPSDKKEDKKNGGAKATKDNLESPKSAGLTKEKSNVEKKSAKKAK